MNEEEKEKIKEANKKIEKGVSEFKKFIMKGNVIDLAVGVIVGGAFGDIVTSLVNDVLMPAIGILIGGIDFSSLSITIADATIAYGSFIQQIVNFLIISICVFLMVKVIAKLTKKKEEEKKEVKKSDEVILLEEIRDLLKEKEKTDSSV